MPTEKVRTLSTEAQPPSTCTISYPIRLAEGKIESVPDLINLAFEYGIFFRWIFFKNRPRGNLLFVRSLLIVGFFAALFFRFRHDWELLLLGIDVDPAILLAGAVVFGYWSMLSAFYSKSAACNQIYLEMIKAGGEGHTITAKLLSNALAIELLTLDLWAHRRFRMLFARNLYRAIEHAYSGDSQRLEMKLPAKIEDLYALVNGGHLQSKEARVLLDNYQDYLMYRTNKLHSQAG